LTQRVGESPVKFFAVHAKKWGENRVPDVALSKYVVPYTFLSRDTKNVFYGDLISTTQY
jgi:hypothetical protein